jgi:chromosomal replication initiation ATPase DnaA
LGSIYKPQNFRESWEKEFKVKYRQKESCVILLTSPPGSGKTYLLEREIFQEERRRGRECERVDCSSDIFVEKAIDSVLSELFPSEGRPALLVADEYHMLSSEHKEELFRWITPRLHWLKVVLIGNRTNGISSCVMEFALISTQHKIRSF